MRTVPIVGASASGGAVPLLIPCFCFNTDLVGSAAYIFGDKVGNRYQIQTVDPATTLKLPAVGIIISKSAPSLCVVQLGGVVRGLYTGLTPRKRCFVGISGGITQDKSSIHPAVGVRFLQEIGVALSATDIVVNPQTPMGLLPL